MSIDPPVQEGDRIPEVHRYRALAFHRDGRILNVVSFSAHGDDAAQVVARGMVDGHAIELWEGERFVERFDPTVS